MHKPADLRARQQYLPIFANRDASDLISLHVPLTSVPYTSLYSVCLYVSLSVCIVQVCATQYAVCEYMPHTMYASMSVSECVACQAVCDCMLGTAWPPGTAGQSGVPGHPRLRPLSSMLELVPTLQCLLHSSFHSFVQNKSWTCKLPSRLTHVVIIIASQVL